MTAVIEGPEYEQARQRLALDHVVKRMAAEVLNVADREIVDEDGTPRWGFIRGATERYAELGGGDTGPRHIGAIAEAVLRVRAQILAVSTR